MQPNSGSEQRRTVNKAFFTVADVAEKVGVHPGTIRRWERNGVIPIARRRRGRRIYNDYDLYVIEQKVFDQQPGETNE